ncbi:hypothetical protein DENSPDRAFT_848987 [Dentipellis sp. KUC8613]|nr:hypothetical protein DENSPDRAFT_848987 [Dentipellis sp. KUC8613]
MPPLRSLALALHLAMLIRFNDPHTVFPSLLSLLILLTCPRAHALSTTHPLFNPACVLSLFACRSYVLMLARVPLPALLSLIITWLHAHVTMPYLLAIACHTAGIICMWICYCACLVWCSTVLPILLIIIIILIVFLNANSNACIHEAQNGSITAGMLVAIYKPNKSYSLWNASRSNSNDSKMNLEGGAVRERDACTIARACAAATHLVRPPDRRSAAGERIYPFLYDSAMAAMEEGTLLWLLWNKGLKDMRPTSSIYHP